MIENINTEELISLKKKNGEILDCNEWNKLISIIDYIIRLYNDSSGLSGTNGKSAYELAVEQGYNGTLSLWLESLRGQDGLNGTNGITPRINPTTKHWMIGGTDTGILAEGTRAEDILIDIKNSNLPNANESSLNKLYLKNSTIENVKEAWITVTSQTTVIGALEVYQEDDPDWDQSNDAILLGFVNGVCGYYVVDYQELGSFIPLKLGDTIDDNSISKHYTVITRNGNPAWSGALDGIVSEPTTLYNWELIGSTQVNLENYYTKSQIDTNFQSKLVSGTNIKTIFNNSVLGEGNISLPIATKSDIDSYNTQTPVDNAAITPANLNYIANLINAYYIQYDSNEVVKAAQAMQNGRVVICVYSDNNVNYYLTCHGFAGLTTGEMLFSGIINNTLYYCSAVPDEGWSKVSTLSLSGGGSSGTEMVDVGSSSLPTASASTMNKLYLKDSSNPNINNIKEEWVTISYQAVTYNNKEYKVIDKGIAEGEYVTEHIEPGTYDGEILLHPSREFSGASWDANGVCYGTDLVEEWVEDNQGWESVELRLGDSYTIRGGFTVVATTSGWTVIDEVPTTYVWELTGGSIKKGNFDTFDVTLPTFPNNTRVDLSEAEAKALFNVSTLAELFSVVGDKITQGYFAKVSYTEDNITQTSICNCYVFGDGTNGKLIVVGELNGMPINIMVKVASGTFNRCVVQTSLIQPLASVATSGSYTDLADKPTIPTVPSNETAVSGGSTLSVVTTGEKYIWNNKANIWRGTQAQYDLLTPDNNTIYIITATS